MMRPDELQGVFVPIITPMKKGFKSVGRNKFYCADKIDNPIDYKKFFMLSDDLLNAGVAGICVAGTTGQSATLDHEEQVDLIVKAYHNITMKKAYADGWHFIAGASSNCTREALKISTEVEKRIGPTTFLHLTGYYNNPPQEGVYEHFKTIADMIQGNIILYTVPSRTKSNIEPETTIELAKHPKIIGIKDASGDLKQIEKVIKNTNPDNFRVLSGEDKQITEIIKMGGYGAIAATANIAPKLFVEMTDYALKKDFKNAEKIQEMVENLINTIFCVKNPIPLAYMFRTRVRLPLVDIVPNYPEKAKYIDNILEEYPVKIRGIYLSKYKK